MPDPSPEFAAELANWGPAARSAPPTLKLAQDYCRRIATGHYENFPVVSVLLPKPLQQHFYNVYSWCRWADDLGDEVGDTTRALESLAWWREEITACYAGQGSHPVTVALAETIREFQIPQQPFLDLISAFEQDQTVLEYDTCEQLFDYCRRSADPVGRLVLHLCRQAKPENFGWSDSICTGLQLANFWQDVARDYDIHRVYLPREDRERFGYTAEQLARRETNSAFLELMRFEVARARKLLSPWSGAGEPELRVFPLRVQIDLELFARGGERILDRIEGIGYRVWDQRPKVTKWDVVQLFARCVTHALIRPFRGRASASHF